MRCYNGCPDSALWAVLDDNANARAELDKLGLRATYFPMEEKWGVFGLTDHRMVSGLHDSLRAAADHHKGDVNGH